MHIVAWVYICRQTIHEWKYLLLHRSNLYTSRLIIKGGTDADMAPPGDYLTHVLAPMLRHLFGISLAVELKRRGFFPRGGGLMHVDVTALQPDQTLPPINLQNRGEVSGTAKSAETTHRTVTCCGLVAPRQI